jgi:hypothetical protein
MKPSIACVVLTLLVAAGHADEKTGPPPPACVVMAGKAASFIQASSVRAEIKAGEDVQKKLDEALKQVTATTFKVGEKAGVVVVLPANTVKLEDALTLIGASVAVEGTLGSTDNAVLIAAAGATGAKRLPLLVADKVVRLDETNKDRFPAENHAVIEGVVSKVEVRAGAEAFGWAIRNANGLIPFTLPMGGTPPRAGAAVRASGKVRVAGGQLVLEATKIEEGKK